MLDQRALPTRESYLTLRTPEEVADAIRDMVVRGAPAIGIAAAMGIALGVQQLPSDADLESEFKRFCELFENTRPTARNLFWAIERMRQILESRMPTTLPELAKALEEEALRMQAEDIATNRRIGEHGQRLLAEKCTILTHCNTGSLATAGFGTALGVVRAAFAAGKAIEVLADETRPFLQGSRLTAWEMMKEGIPCTLITDNMAGYFMQQGEVQAAIVGADRIAANGDTANKIGTYSVAVLAQAHQIPFYVAAPLSTIDLSCPTGLEIPIEERNRREVTHIAGYQLAPPQQRVANPAFDVTPHHLISAIITERGVVRAPLQESIAELFGSQPEGGC